MFTGIVTDMGTVRAIRGNGDTRFEFTTAYDTETIVIGASISCSGACMTVIDKGPGWFAVSASAETLDKTTMGAWTVGTPVNFERSLKIGDRLGGHFVTGHIDAVGHLDERLDDEDWSTCWYRAAPALTRQMAGKGSIAVDGVSLTLVDVERDRFSVALIPHTLQVTTLGLLRPGDPVNLETDVLAKYVEQQLAGGR